MDERARVVVVVPYTVAGVESITGTAMTIRTVATCAPNQNLAVQRELRERIKAALDEAGIQPPPAPPAIGVSR